MKTSTVNHENEHENEFFPRNDNPDNRSAHDWAFDLVMKKFTIHQLNLKLKDRGLRLINIQ
jgi:hypothetical protein